MISQFNPFAMPVHTRSEHSVVQHSGSVPYPTTPTTRSSARQSKKSVYFVGPLADADPSIKGLSRSKAEKVNDKRISDALHLLAPHKPRKPQTCEHEPSRTILFLGVGNDNLFNAGRWGVRASRSHFYNQELCTNNFIFANSAIVVTKLTGSPRALTKASLQIMTSSNAGLISEMRLIS